MADIIITPLPGKIDFFTNKGDNTPINGVKLLGSNLVFYGPISASSVLTNGGGRYVTTTSPTINYVPKFNSNSSIANSLIFDSGTNVGIGTNKPSASLQVISSTSGATLLRADGTSGTLFSVVDDLTDSLMSVNNSAGLPVFEVFADDRIVAGQYGTNDFVLTNNKVGIGTNNPIGKLHVTGSTSTPAGIFLGDVGIGTTSFVYSNANRADVEIYGTTDALLALRNATANSYIHKTGNDFYINNGGAGNLVLQNNSSERMRINSSGNVGIGTSSPSHLLTLSRATQTTAYQLNFNTDGGITDGNYTGIRFSQGAGGGTELGNIRLTYFTTGATALSLGVRNAAQAVYIGTDGNVGISNTNPTSKLYIEGGSANWSLPNPGTSVGTIHLDPGSTTDNFGNAITFGASDSANGETAQAGIYVRSDGGYGTVIYLATTDDYNTGSKVRFTVGNNGNIGIATTAPAYRLDVNGTFNVSGTSTLAGVSVSGTINSSATEAIRINNNNGYISFYNTAGNTRTGYLQGNTGNSVILAAENSSAILFAIGGSEIARIATSGNVGIGTTSPATKLDVYGPISVRGTNVISTGADIFGGLSYDIYGNIRVLRSTSAQGDGMYIGYGGSGGNLRFFSNSGTTEFMTIATSGNVGIGTTAPARKLDISGSAVRSFSAGGTGEPGFIVDYPSSNGYGAFFIHVNGTRRWRIGSVGDTNVQPALNFWQEGTGSRMIINNLGNVGIGTSSPASKLHIVDAAISPALGNLRVRSTGGNSSICIDSNSTSDFTYFTLAQAGTGRFEMGINPSSSDFYINPNVQSGANGAAIYIKKSDGNVGIGTTSPGAKLAIIGNRLTDPNNDAQSREIYYAVSRTVATAAGSTTLLGYLTPTSRSDNAVIEIYHHDCGTIEYVRFVVNSVYYTGATTDWVQLPSISNLSYSGALDGCTVDARMSSNFGNIELRLRSLGGSCADMAVFVSIKTNCLFTSQTTTGTGGTVAGLLCNNAYQFPVGANRFQGTRNRGLYVINTGNVGINTQNPTAMLHVSGSTAGDEVFVGTISDNQIVGGRTGGSFGIATKSASNGNLILTAGANMYLRSGGSNDRVFIKSDGNVGIGNVTPQTKLEVSGETMVNYTNAIITVQGGSGYGLIRMYGNNSSVEMQMDSHSSNANAGTLGTYTNHPVYIKTNNTTKVSITTSGNVGIGTTSPSATLTVIATNNTGSRIQLGTAANNTFMDANKVNDFMILTAPFNSNPASVANAGAKWGIKLNGSIDTINTKAKSAAIYAVSEDTLAGYNRQVGLALHTSGFDLENTERVRISNTGNVGIGVTTPRQILHVNGSILLDGVDNGYTQGATRAIGYGSNSGGTSTNGFSGMDIQSVSVVGNYSQNVRFWTHHYGQGSGGTPRMVIQYDGNIGIGTTSPSVKLAVSDGTTVAQINPSSGVAYFGTVNNYPMALSVNSSEKVRIAADGNVGIGTSTLFSRFVVSNGSSENFEFSTASTVLNGGTIEYINRATSTTRPDFNFYLGSSNGAYKFFTQGTNERMRIAADGNIGINTSSPAAKLDVNGSAIIRGTLSSDSSRVAVYTTLTGASGNWFPLFQINDAVDGTVLCNIKTFAHSSVTFTAAKGYSPSQTHVITILNSQQNANSGYANITGVRIRESGTVEIQLSWASGPAVDISVQVIGTSYTPTFVASLAATTAVDTIVDSVALQSGLIRTKRNMVADGYVTGGSIGAGISAPTSILHVRASAPTSVGTAPTGTNVLIDSNTSNYITFRNTADNGTYAGLAFLDNNVGGYIVFRNYTGDVTTGSDSMIYGTYQDHIFQNSASETINGKTETMRIKSNGNVGIGTNNPGYKLDVNGTFRSTGDLYTNGNIVISRAGAYLYINGTNSDAEIVWQANGSNRWAAGMNVGDATENFNVYNYTTATTNLTILKANGNVGIGSTAPAYKLDVNGSIGVVGLRFVDQSTSYFRIFEPAGNIAIYLGNAADPANYYDNSTHFFRNRGGSSTYAVIEGNGNLGIGTTSVTEAVHVYRAANSIIRMQAGGGDVSGIRMDDASTSGYLLKNRSSQTTNNALAGALYTYTDNNKAFQHIHAGTPLFTILSGGNVGIGTTSPSNKLEVGNFLDAVTNKIIVSARYEYQPEFNFRLGQSGTNLDWIGGVISCGDDGNYNGVINFKTANAGRDTPTTKMVIKASGNVGIGTTTVPSPLTIYNNADVWHFRLGSSAGELRFGGATNNGAVIQAYTPAGVVRDLYIQRDGGNVGIGTNSPGGKLHVIGEIISLKNGSNSQTTQLYLANASNTRAYNVQLNSAGSNLALWGYNSSNVWQNLVNINYNGNVGVGTTTPSASLHTVSSTAGATLLRADGTSGTLFSVVDDLTDSLMSVNNSAGLPVFEVFADDRIVGGQYGANDFVITNNRVGIGTSNPLAKLHVTGSTSLPAAVFLGDVGIGTTSPTSQTNYRFLQVNGPVSAIIEATVGGTRVGGFDSTSNILYVGSIGSFPVVFRTAVDEKMRITANGNIGIGTSSPNGKLTIVGDGSQNGYSGVVRVSDTAGPKWAAIGLPDTQTGTTSANNYYLIGRGGAYTDRVLSIHIPNTADYGSGAQPKFGVYSTGSDLLASVEASTGTSYFKGNVGIGSTSPSAKLDVVGSVKVSAKLIQNSTTVSVSGTNQTLTLNLDTAAVYVVSMASGATITTISYTNRDNNPAVNTIMLVVKYAGTASITFTNVIWANGVPPTLTGTNAFADVFMFTSYQGGAGTPVWIGTVVAQALVSTNL